MNDVNLMKFLLVASSGGVSEAAEQMEREGQRKVENSERLPLDLKDPKSTWEKIGFVFGQPINKFFQRALFPIGWRSQKTNHSMWSQLVDDKGFIRGQIFYKSSFYDESAHAYLHTRFFLRGERDENGKFIGYNLLARMSNREEKVLSFFEASEGENSAILKDGWEEANKFMKENYPEWLDPTAYWDKEF